MVVLPKSINAARIAENAKISSTSSLTLTMEEVDLPEEVTATGWDPRDQR